MKEELHYNDPRTVSVATSDTILAGPNMKRKSIVVSNLDATNPVFIKLRSAATATSGFKLTAGQNFTFTQDAYGDAIKEEIHAIATGGAVNVEVIDIFKGG